jgi:hypothetical protein
MSTKRSCLHQNTNQSPDTKKQKSGEKCVRFLPQLATIQKFNYTLQQFIKQYANSDSTITITKYTGPTASDLYNYKPINSNKEEKFKTFVNNLENIQIYPDTGKLKKKQLIGKLFLTTKKCQQAQEKCNIDMAIIDEELDVCDDEEAQTLSANYNSLKTKLQEITNQIKQNKTKMNTLKKSLFTSDSCDTILYITITSPTTICITKNKTASNENLQRSEIIQYKKLETFMCVQRNEETKR